MTLLEKAFFTVILAPNILQFVYIQPLLGLSPISSKKRSSGLWLCFVPIFLDFRKLYPLELLYKISSIKKFPHKSQLYSVHY